MCRACSKVTDFSTAATAGIAAAFIDRVSTPNPISTTASAGSEAASPHTLTYFFLPAFMEARLAPLTVSLIIFSTAGCHGLFRCAKSPSRRSAAMVYWVRSFVPIDTKSTSPRIASAFTAAAGVSTITPCTGRSTSLSIFAKLRASEVVEIMGAITQISASDSSYAFLMASSWRVSTPGTVQSVRNPRTPSAGFSSSFTFRNGRGLSAPASRVRTTICLPGKASKTDL